MLIDVWKLKFNTLESPPVMHCLLSDAKNTKQLKVAHR